MSRFRLNVLRLSMVLPARIYQLAGAQHPCGHGSGWVMVSVESGVKLVKFPCFGESLSVFSGHAMLASHVGQLSIRL
jgi:hypothetical protein